MPLRLGGLKAKITCEGEELPQYQVTVENEGLISCYVASEAGRVFVVRYASDGHIGDMYCRIFVDGVEVHSTCNKSAPLQTGWSTFHGVVSDCTVRQFVFASVETNDQGYSPARDLSKLGTVELRLSRTVIVPSTNDPLHTEAFHTIGPVSKKTKFTGFHYTTLGAPIKAKALNRLVHKPIDSNENPYVVFRFRYVSKELLKAWGILPTELKAKLIDKKEANAKKRAAPAEQETVRNAKTQATGER